MRNRWLRILRFFNCGCLCDFCCWCYIQQYRTVSIIVNHCTRIAQVCTKTRWVTVWSFCFWGIGAQFRQRLINNGRRKKLLGDSHSLLLFLKPVWDNKHLKGFYWTKGDFWDHQTSTIRLPPSVVSISVNRIPIRTNQWRWTLRLIGCCEVK